MYTAILDDIGFRPVSTCKIAMYSLDFERNLNSSKCVEFQIFDLDSHIFLLFYFYLCDFLSHHVRLRWAGCRSPALFQGLSPPSGTTSTISVLKINLNVEDPLPYTYLQVGRRLKHQQWRSLFLVTCNGRTEYWIVWSVCCSPS